MRTLHGRREITVNEGVLTAENVVRVLSDCYIKHLVNRDEIEYLYKYYKGDQPVLYREKEVRPEICNHIVENRANAIVTFRVGYTVGKPIQYISNVSDEEVSKQVARLNDMMRVSGKWRKDKQLVEWMMICGTGYRIIMPALKPGAAPYDMQTLDPRNAFVIYRNDVGHTPLAGVYYTTDDQKNETFHVYTDSGQYFKIVGWQSGKILEATTYSQRDIPIVEYPLNMARLGAFEVVLPLLDELNNLESNRMDSVEQFVQSLLVATNCNFEDGVTANTIREAGMIVLRSIGENKADIKVISETLNQDQTQTLKTSILDAINEICGIPSQGDANRSDSSNNGAVILKNGWQGAETRACDFEMMFSEPEQRTLGLVSEICNTFESGMHLDAKQIEPKFTRRNYEDLMNRAQVLTTMLSNDKVHPQNAYEASGMFIDAQGAYIAGMEWYEEQQKRLAEQGEGEGNGTRKDGSTWIEGYWQNR